MPATHNYYGYDTDFDWDRRFFIPFITNFCLYYKYIPLTFAFVINWLILFKSPNYSKEYRRALAFYHISEFFFDIQLLILFVPYPLFPHPIFMCHGLICQLGGPPHLAMTLTMTVAVFASISLFVLLFIRMRAIVPQESRFYLSFIQSVILLGMTSAIFLIAILGYAVLARDTVNKTQILQRPEYAWVQTFPGAVVYGEMFDLGSFNTEIDYIGFCTLYGVLFLAGVLLYSAYALAREKKKIVHVKSKAKDNATKMLMIQLFGAFFTFITPLFVFFASLRLGFPTTNPNVHSFIRCFVIFLFLNNSMVCFSIHLLMNRAYQKQIVATVRQILTRIQCPTRVLESNLFISRYPAVSMISSSMFSRRDSHL